MAAVLALMVLVFVLLGDAFLGARHTGLRPVGAPPGTALPPGDPTALSALDVGSPTALAVGRGAIWIGRVRPRINGSQDAGELLQVNPRTGTIVASVHLPSQPVALAVGEGSVWAGLPSTQLRRHPGTFEPLLLQIDPVRHRVSRTIGLPGGPDAIAVGPGAVFVTGSSNGARQRSLTRVDIGTGERKTVSVDIGFPFFAVHDSLAFVAGSLWALTPQGVTHPVLDRIDPTTLRIVGRAHLRGDGGVDLVATDGALWITTHGPTAMFVYRFDLATEALGTPVSFGVFTDVFGVVPRGPRTWVVLGRSRHLALATLDTTTGGLISGPTPLADRSGTGGEWRTGVAYHLAVDAGGTVWTTALTDRDSGEGRLLLRLGFCTTSWFFWHHCQPVP